MITNAYVYAFNPVPAKDKGPSIKWHLYLEPCLRQGVQLNVYDALLYMRPFLFAEDRGPCIMQHYIQSPTFDKRRGCMYSLYMLLI